MRRKITVRHCQERLARYDTLPPPRLHNASHANHSRYQIGRRRKREREREDLAPAVSDRPHARSAEVCAHAVRRQIDTLQCDDPRKTS